MPVEKDEFGGGETLLSVEDARVNVLGVGISALNMNEAVRTLIEAREKNRSGYVCVTGVHGVIESQQDPDLRRIHNKSFLTVPDGMPTVWMGREQGFTRMGRVYGPDLMLAVCEQTAALNQRADIERQMTGGPISDLWSPTSAKKYWTHFLYGATEEMLVSLKANLEKRFPGVRIVGTYAPPFRPLNEEEEEDLRQVVAECKPDYFWVGLSTPKQENFMAAHAPLAQDGPVDSCSMIVDEEPLATNNQQPTTNSGAKRHPLDAGIMLGVGAAFPIHAGLQKDAPEWIKNSGLQWFHRLCQEPRRLWRRYLDIVPSFLWLAFLQLLGVKKYPLDQ